MVADRDRPEQFRAHLILLTTWIIELKLNEISKLWSQIESKDPDDQTLQGTEMTLKIEEDHFWNFINEFNDDLDQKSLYQVLQQHGKIDECIEYAQR